VEPGVDEFLRAGGWGEGETGSVYLWWPRELDLNAVGRLFMF